MKALLLSFNNQETLGRSADLLLTTKIMFFSSFYLVHISAFSKTFCLQKFYLVEYEKSLTNVYRQDTIVKYRQVTIVKYRQVSNIKYRQVIIVIIGLYMKC